MPIPTMPSPTASAKVRRRGIKFRTLSGQTAGLLFADTAAGPSYFAVAVPKAGSTLFYNLIRNICDAAEQPLLNVVDQLFVQGCLLDDCPAGLVSLFERKGMVFTGFRQPWLLEYVSQYRTATKLLLVRDPRDLAVSFYFSMRQSHPLPDSGACRDVLLAARKAASERDLSEFVLAGRAETVFTNLDAFLRQTRRMKGFKVFRYEDVIWSKRQWCAEIAESLKIVLPADTLNRIADAHDVRPQEERPERHIRQVTPGNYRKHLSEEAVRYVELRCKPAMDAFNYPSQ